MTEKQLIRFGARIHDVPEAEVAAIRRQWISLLRAGYFTNSCASRLAWGEYLGRRVRDGSHRAGSSIRFAGDASSRRSGRPREGSLAHKFDRIDAQLAAIEGL